MNAFCLFGHYHHAPVNDGLGKTELICVCLSLYKAKAEKQRIVASGVGVYFSEPFDFLTIVETELIE
jgi:hypothetical protein